MLEVEARALSLLGKYFTMAAARVSIHGAQTVLAKRNLEDTRAERLDGIQEGGGGGERCPTGAMTG